MILQLLLLNFHFTRTEIPITTRTQPSPINTPLVHIPNPETVEQYVNYKHPTESKLLDFNLNSILYTFVILNIHAYLHSNYHQNSALLLPNIIFH